MKKRQELVLYVKFRLTPSKRVFSRMKVNLSFDGELIKTFFMGIPYYFARKEEFPIRSVLSLKQVESGIHTVKVEIVGLWPLGPSVSKETSFDYYAVAGAPMTKALPRVKKIEGPSIAVVSDKAKKLYEDIEKRRRKEIVASRDKY
jgi:hypothetical protein